MRRIIRRPQAKRDIIEQADYLGLGSMNASDRFLEAVQNAMRTIAESPALGAPRDFPEFAGLRVFFVPGFTKVGLYYLTTHDTVEIVRVLHSARDITSIFAPEDEEG